MFKHELVSQYNISKETPPELLHRIQMHEKLSRSSGSIEESAKYPINDEDLIQDDRHGDVAWPEPMGFSRNLDSVLEFILVQWSFFQAFSGFLRLSPFSFEQYADSLQWQDDLNPIFEAACTRLVNLAAKARRSCGRASFSSPLEKVSLPTIGSGEDAEAKNPPLEEGGYKWYEPSKGISCSKQVFGLFSEIASVSSNLCPVLGSILTKSPSLLLLDAREKACAIHILLELVLNHCASEIRYLFASPDGYRKFVENQIEREVEAKKSRKHYIGELNKLAKEIHELGRQIERGKERNISKEVKKMESLLRKMKAEEASLHRKIDHLTREHRKHSAIRSLHLGQDRRFRRYWWLDSQTIAHSSSHADAGFGRLLVEIVNSDSEKEWKYYNEPEQIEALLEWLNPLGVREMRLKNRLSEISSHLVSILQKRHHRVEEDSEEVIRKRGRRACSSMAPFLKYVNVLGKKA